MARDEVSPDLALVVEQAARVCSEGALMHWLQTARPGDRICYAFGYYLPPADTSATLMAIRHALDAGKVTAVQHRQRDAVGRLEGYRYLLVRRRQERPLAPHQRFVPRFRVVRGGGQ